MLLVAAIAQATVLHAISIRGAVFSPVLVLVVWYTLEAQAERALPFALIAGLCTDALSGGTGGAWTIATVLTALVVIFVKYRFAPEDTWFIVALTGVATLARDAFFWVTMYLSGYPVGLATAHFHTALWQALLNALLIAALAGPIRVVREVDRW